VARYNPELWHDFFVASAGAAAALTGLLFVAVSINLERILEYEGLPERALETLVALLATLTASLFALAPGQSTKALGVELLLVGTVLTLVMSRQIRGGDQVNSKRRSSRIGLRAVSSLPFLIGGISLIAERGGGLYWVLAGVVGAFIAASANAWVLLVEIQR
jgi:modulator of FtsH protease